MATLVNRRTPTWTAIVLPIVAIATGVLLMAAPALFGYIGSSAEISHRIAGPILVFLWIVAIAECTRVVRWWTIPIAIWLLLEPAVLATSTFATILSLSAGALNIALALLTDAGAVREHYAGGWMALMNDRANGGVEHG